MAPLTYTAYQKRHRHLCMALFEQNCPQYFAVEERGDYAQFLDSAPENYWLVGGANDCVACYGLTIQGSDASINWIMVDPTRSSKGYWQCHDRAGLFDLHRSRRHALEVSDQSTCGALLRSVRPYRNVANVERVGAWHAQNRYGDVV